MEHSVWNILSGKTGWTFHVLHCSGKFSTKTTWKVLFHLLSTWIFQELFVNGKKPRFVGIILWAQRFLSTSSMDRCKNSWSSLFLGWNGGSKLNDDKYVHLRSAISKTEDKMRNMIFSSFIELFLCILWRSQYLI